VLGEIPTRTDAEGGPSPGEEFRSNSLPVGVRSGDFAGAVTTDLQAINTLGAAGPCRDSQLRVRTARYHAGTMTSDPNRSEPSERFKCRITVLRKDFNEDLYRAHPYGEPAACSRFEVGQEFVTDSPWDPPPAFCPWAWGDLRPIIHRLHAGNPTVMVSCCTDGLRPVFFRLEAVPV